jgi:prophage regulatory protein
MTSINVAHKNEMDSERIVRMDELLRRLQISRATVYRWLDEGRFPRPVRLGERTIGWRESSLSGWLAEREAA